KNPNSSPDRRWSSTVATRRGDTWKPRNDNGSKPCTTAARWRSVRSGAPIARRNASSWGGLSPHSRGMRFLGEFAGLPDAELRRLVDVDGVRKVAFAAFDSCDRLVGVSRFSCDADPRGCECAVAVADAWQGVGLGTCLMR